VKGIHLVIKAKGRIMKKEKLVFNLTRDDLAIAHKFEKLDNINIWMFRESTLNFNQCNKASEIYFTDEDGSKVCLKKRIK
jgi:hypothetical protein